MMYGECTSGISPIADGTGNSVSKPRQLRQGTEYASDSSTQCGNAAVSDRTVTFKLVLPSPAYWYIVGVQRALSKVT